MAETRIETLKEMHLVTDLREGAEIVAPAGLRLAGGPGLLAGTDRGAITALRRV